MPGDEALLREERHAPHDDNRHPMSSPTITTPPWSARLLLMLIVPPMLWASNAVIGRIAIQSIAPLWLNALRWVLAGALLLPLGWRVLASAEARAQIAARWRHFVVLGALGVGAYNSLQYLALRSSTPLNVTLIAASGPVWMLAIGRLRYGERGRPAQWLGALISLLGVTVVLSRGDMGGLWRVQFVAGDLLMLLAVVCWSFYSWMLARPPASMRGVQRPGWDWSEFLLVQIAFGLVWALGGAALGEVLMPPGPAWVWSLPLALALLYIAIFPSLVAYRLWGLAVPQAGPEVAAIFANMTPLYAAMLSAALLGEWPRPFHGLAFVLIALGIGVATWRPRAVRQG